MRVASSHTSRSLNGSILQLPATRAREWRTGPTSSTKGHHGRDDSTRTKHCRSESNSTTTCPLPKEKLSRAADLRVRIEQRNTPKTRTRAYVAGNYRNSQVRWTRRGHWCLTLKTPIARFLAFRGVNSTATSDKKTEGTSVSAAKMGSAPA
jgi:hypothetical protein